MPRQNIASGTTWEAIVGYSRAVRVGNIVEVAGTTAVDDAGAIVGAGDAAAQTHFILTKIETALHAAGAQLSDVVRTRMFVTDITQWAAIGRAHGAIFGDIRPVTSMYQIVALIEPGLLIEIEVTAIVDAVTK